MKHFQNQTLLLPHLGASTYEAQLKAGLETVQNVSDILNGELSSVLNI